MYYPPVASIAQLGHEFSHMSKYEILSVVCPEYSWIYPNELLMTSYLELKQYQGTGINFLRVWKQSMI